MRIVVFIKQVPETSAVKMDPATGTMIRDGVEAIINPLDLYAIEVAIRLLEQGGEGEVVVISMGPPKTIFALREALAMGCDRAILLSDKAFAGADTWATSYVLAAAVRKVGDFDIVICGERATDGDTGQVGPGVASFLDLPVASYVSKVEGISGGVCRLYRLVEDGQEVIEMRLPGVLTVVKDVSDPRLPTLRNKHRARQTDVPTWTAAQIGVDLAKVGLIGSPTRVVKIFRPTVARSCQKLPAEDKVAIGKAIDKVIDYLDEKELI